MILKNVEIFFLRADPARPDATFDQKNPSWTVQLRTSNKQVLQQWKDANLTYKPVIPEDGSDPYYKLSLKKRSIRQDGGPAEPVQVVGGTRDPETGELVVIDPNKVGNGSVGNVRILQREYQKRTGGTGISSILMGVQITRLVPRHYVPREEFAEEGMEVVESLQPEAEEVPEAGDDADDGAPEVVEQPPVKPAPKAPVKPAAASPKAPPAPPKAKPRVADPNY